LPFQQRSCDNSLASERIVGQNAEMQQDFQKNPPRPWSPGEIAAWAVILVSVALLFGLPLLFKQARLERERAASAKHPSVELFMISRYLVGSHALLLIKHSGDSERLIKSMDREIKTPWDELRAAIIRGEIISGPSAITTLNDLAEKHPDLQNDIDILRPIY